MIVPGPVAVLRRGSALFCSGARRSRDRGQDRVVHWGVRVQLAAVETLLGQDGFSEPTALGGALMGEDGLRAAECDERYDAA